MDKESIIGYEAIWDSMMKCKKGVMWKDSAASFVHNAAEQCLKLSEELLNGTYSERPHQFFTVTEPKRREVMSISFRDRVYQRSLNDNVIYPTMVKSFIRDNYACQKGRGTDDARDRLTEFMRRHYRKHKTHGYVLQIDIKGYYPHMRHDVAKEVFWKHLDPEAYEMAERILDGFQGDIGFNPGSQIIQIAGISVLNDLDHYCKEVLRAKHYCRYMDDIIIISDDKAYLERCLNEIQHQLDRIGFETHPTKTRIFPLEKGIRFLGFIFKLTDTGKVLRLIPGDKVKHERKKLYRLVQKAKRGEISRYKCNQCYLSWRAHAELGTAKKTILRMDQYYKQLWEGF